MAWKRAGNLAERLKDLRLALGRSSGRIVTQEDFGELAGVTGQSVSDWERGESLPSRSTLARLAKRVGILVSGFQEGGPMPSTMAPKAPSGPATPSEPQERASVKALRHFVEETEDELLVKRKARPVPAHETVGLLYGALRLAAATRPEEPPE